jgi:hypothetical protein
MAITPLFANVDFKRKIRWKGKAKGRKAKHERKNSLSLQHPSFQFI